MRNLWDNGCVKLAGCLDVRPLLDALEAKPELWNEITVRQKYPGSAHDNTETIFVRGPKGFTADLYFNDLGSYNYPAAEVLRDCVAPLLNAVSEKIEVQEMGRVLIVKLKPGGHVKEHVDEGRYADYFSRFHIVLSTNEKCLNTTGGEAVHWPVGTAWWFNHKLPHTADNGGDTDRIHIIFDAVTKSIPTPDQLVRSQTI